MLVTNGAAGVVQKYAYDAYGNNYEGSFSGTNSIGYNGKRYDGGTGWYDYGFRDYDSRTGRFTTVDPIRDGMNWYAYCGGDPINYVDLWGLSRESDKESTALSVAKSFGKGVFDAFVGDLKSIGNTFSHPIKTAQNAYNSVKNEVTAFANDPGAYVDNKVDTIKQSVTDFIESSPEEKAYVLGGVAEKTTVVVVTIKAVKTVTNKVSAGNVASNTKTIQNTSPVKVGQAGEKAVKSTYDIGGKSKIQVNGRTRIPDGLTESTLSEVKNVKKQSFTQQLHDYLDYAESNDLSMDLYVRSNTVLSKPLEEAITSGRINLKIIPEN